MHWIVAHAAPLSDGQRAALASLALPNLDYVIKHWSALPRDEDDDASTLSPPHERVHAQALGWQGADGALPWAARQAALDGIEVGSRAWGLVTPVHARVGSDGVHLADPEALALGEAESHAFFDALRPLFQSAGFELVSGANAARRWYAAHESLAGLATASIDRVAGRAVDAWLPRQSAARPLRRLQNEAQMALHGHPLNQAREAAGALPLNSFWLSGCGVRQAEPGEGALVDDRLRAPALREDARAWAVAWRAIDGDLIAPMVAAGERGHAMRLTVCSERGAAGFVAKPRIWWQRLADRVMPPRAAAATLLASL